MLICIGGAQTHAVLVNELRAGVGVLLLLSKLARAPVVQVVQVQERDTLQAVGVYRAAEHITCPLAAFALLLYEGWLLFAQCSQRLQKTVGCPCAFATAQCA
jgi:hypothetical protein